MATAGVTPSDLLLIDIDFDYSSFMTYFIRFYEKHVKLILDKFGLRPLVIEYKESTNHNVHVKILLDKPVDYETYLHLLLALGCDLGLVSISNARLRTFGDPLVKQFYKKVAKK